MKRTLLALVTDLWAGPRASYLRGIHWNQVGSQLGRWVQGTSSCPQQWEHPVTAPLSHGSVAPLLLMLLNLPSSVLSCDTSVSALSPTGSLPQGMGTFFTSFTAAFGGSVASLALWQACSAVYQTKAVTRVACPQPRPLVPSHPLLSWDRQELKFNHSAQRF